MKTITEISKYKFLEMIAFVYAYKKVNGEMPKQDEIVKQFGEIRGRLFANLLLAYDTGKINMDKFIRATLRDDGMIEFKHYRE